MSTEVLFGKYRGRPVEEMLSDGQYMAWLEAQPWFRERFGHLRTAKDQDAMDRTPVHNKLQTLFLDEPYQAAFAHAAIGTWFAEVREKAENDKLLDLRSIETLKEKALKNIERLQPKAVEQDGGSLQNLSARLRLMDAASSAKRIAEMQEQINAWPAICAAIESAAVQFESHVKFEHRGADVFLWVDASIAKIRHAQSETWHNLPIDIGSPVVVGSQIIGRLQLRIEIKPTVADEYPAVLRQMNRNKSEFLFVERYQGEGATEAQFVAMFAASGKRVVFKRDVDALL